MGFINTTSNWNSSMIAHQEAKRDKRRHAELMEALQAQQPAGEPARLTWAVDTIVGLMTEVEALRSEVEILRAEVRRVTGDQA